MKKGKERKNLLRGIILPAIGIVCIAISLAIAFPYQSQGGVKLEEVAVGDMNVGKIKSENFTALKTIRFYAEIVTLKVDIVDDVYVGQAWLQVHNSDETGEGSIVAVIPAPRVQRILELAMTRTLDLWVWGYKIPTPQGHQWDYMPFYEIVGAQITDPDVTIKAAIIAP
jgi:hypothetical protein